MAIDSESKRRGALMVGLPFRGILPVVDGNISEGDRRLLAFMYPGLIATAANGVVTAQISLSHPESTWTLTQPESAIALTQAESTITLEGKA